jgi:transcriptional regulator with XRE-family HTH domain
MASTFNEIVSMEVRAEMARQRRTQGDLAAELGLAQVSLSKRLTGVVAWSTDEIEQAAKVLGVSIEQLVTPARGDLERSGT